MEHSDHHNFNDGGLLYKTWLASAQVFLKNHQMSVNLRILAVIYQVPRENNCNSFQNLNICAGSLRRQDLPREGVQGGVCDSCGARLD